METETTTISARTARCRRPFKGSGSNRVALPLRVRAA